MKHQFISGLILGTLLGGFVTSRVYKPLMDEMMTEVVELYGMKAEIDRVQDRQVRCMVVMEALGLTEARGGGDDSQVHGVWEDTQGSKR